MMVIMTFSLFWLTGECDDGDFDFFDIVTDWGEWVYCNGNKIKRCIFLWTAWDDSVSEICWDYEWNEW